MTTATNISGSSVEILIAEDSPTQAQKLQYILEQQGYHVSVAANGELALNAVQQRKPTLIISDVVMPKMDGYELCRRVKSEAALSDVPVILVTTLSDPQDVIRGLECRADNFILKPYDERYLLSRVQFVLVNREMRQSDQPGMGLEIYFEGQRHFITADRLQILNLLLSTYEAAMQRNKDLSIVQEKLQNTNAELQQLTLELEQRVLQRTQELETTNEALRLKADELASMTQQLFQASKLATMGELAASVAHELNNPLATITLRTELLLAQLASNDPKRSSLDIVLSEVERMANLVRSLLEFSRRSHRQISTVDVRGEVAQSVDFLSHYLRNRKIKVEFDFHPVPTVHADRQQLRQLFINILTNASDAMPRGGNVTVRINPGELDNAEAVLMEFVDTGQGIAADNLEKIWEPFFTTKEAGKGTGLGMAICRRIVEEHGGTISITSQVGSGTTVGILLLATNSPNGKDDAAASVLQSE
jgi:signal transduction histidine kinase